ncbi:MAG TPA: bacteriohemerythrin [Geobacteraceae bacterium]
MALFTWDESLAVRIDKLDRQHRHLISLVNGLHDAMKSGNVKEVIEPLLGKLIAYTQEHFDAEEVLMLAHKYPGFMEHKREHNAFVAKVLEFQSQYKTGGVTLSLEIMQFLVDWVKDHIKVMDRRYGPYLNEMDVH